MRHICTACQSRTVLAEKMKPTSSAASAHPIPSRKAVSDAVGRPKARLM